MKTVHCTSANSSSTTGCRPRAPRRSSLTRWTFKEPRRPICGSLPLVGVAQSWVQHQANTGAKDGDIVFYEGYREVSVWMTANATTPTSQAWQIFHAPDR
jgi:hypothetical protein